MTTLGVRETMQQKLLKWASITQAYQFAKIGKAEPGFVTLSRLTHGRTASRRLVPQKTCSPLRQHAVLLEVDSKGIRAFSKGRRPMQGSRGTAIRGKPGVDAWRTFQRSGCRSD